MSEALKVWTDREGRLLRLRLNRPKANIIDAEMVAALDAALSAHGDNPGLLAILIDAEGPHFSFGASVEEHLPGQCAAMLRGLHALILRMVKSQIPILVAVRGQCLGGGLEVAMAGHLMFVAPDAMLGQPEIKLAVFAPAASCLMPERVGRAVAEELLFSGRSIPGSQAVAIRLANAAADDPEAAAVAWFDDHLAGLSGAALRHAVGAVRIGLAERLAERLASVEKLYLDSLMSTRDALEGLQAFIAKRPAKWEHR
ncbi:MAG: cyclohexa-1,5-dienecarbonyl-CoA hydratase [Hyphomicrobiales bacterium]|jgi:cyclohexa-1,5-dienecarbonyl-CoA hydratase|nr:cyclohexa-1,5-dienecarbonyl-CoA hydratase [Hyphomicrobiales bacterium]